MTCFSPLIVEVRAKEREEQGNRRPDERTSHGADLAQFRRAFKPNRFTVTTVSSQQESGAQFPRSNRVGNQRDPRT